MAGKFKPGQSGNPGGRPKKGETLTDILRKYLEGHDDENPAITRKQRLAEELYNRAIEGDVTAIKYTYDRVDGKPVETVDNTHDGTMVITFKSVDGSKREPNDQDDGK